MQLRDTVDKLVEYLSGEDAIVDCTVSLWNTKGANGDKFFIVTVTPNAEVDVTKVGEG